MKRRRLRCAVALASLLVPTTQPVRSAHASAPLLQPDPCRPGDLRVAARLQGAMGHREGSVVFTNRSAHACILKGRPGVQLHDGRGPLVVRIVQDTSQETTGGGASASDKKLGLVRPGHRAFMAIRWGNWCGRAIKGTVSIWVRLPGAARPVITQLRGGGPSGKSIGPPPCLGQGQPSTLDVRPIELADPSTPLPV